MSQMFFREDPARYQVDEPCAHCDQGCRWNLADNTSTSVHGCLSGPSVEGPYRERIALCGECIERLLDQDRFHILSEEV